MAINPRPSGRVVVTGLGAVTPLGNSAEETWQALLAGKSGINRISHLDPSAYPTQIAGEATDFSAEDWLEKKEARRIDRFIALAAAASKMALDDAYFPQDEALRESTGVHIGTGIGGLTFMGEQLKKMWQSDTTKVSPFLVPYMIPDMASGYTSILYKLKGPNSCSVNACATSTNALGEAYHIVKRGDAYAMVAGGTEAPINEIGLSGFCAARAMSTRNDEPKKASRPFESGRDGFVMSEGAGVLILEDYEHAKSRGAKIYGEIKGYGTTGDAYHITAPDPEGDGARRAMKMALETSGIQPEQIDYINAHGTSTPYNDKIETKAIKEVFGEHAKKLKVSSSKSMVGHLLGAAGAVEAIACLLSMRDQSVHPTINLENPDPDCDLDYVPNEKQKLDVEHCLSNSFGFGGHNATLIISQFQD
jgi:3-oxoacyl-[acyl-carrier-protein] synthase II